MIENQQKEIDLLRETMAACCPIEKSKSTGGNESKSTQYFDLTIPENINSEEMKVFQNAPNPFNERTTIQCYIPQAIKKVELCIYNMQGVQVKCLTVTERGAVEIQIQAGQFPAGVYTYFLMGNGKTSETKQMILTK